MRGICPVISILKASLSRKHALTSRNHSYAPRSATIRLPLVAERGMQDRPPNRPVCLTSFRTSPHLPCLHRSLFSHYLARHHPRPSIRRQAGSTLLVLGLWENVVLRFRCYALVVDREDAERRLASGWVVRGRASVQEYLGRARSWPLFLWWVVCMGGFKDVRVIEPR